MKNFLKPTKIKVILFLVFFIPCLGSLPWIPFSLLGDISILNIPILLGFGLTFVCMSVGGCQLDVGCPFPPMWHRVFCLLPSALIIWVFVCFLVWIIDKIRRKIGK